MTPQDSPGSTLRGSSGVERVPLAMHGPELSQEAAAVSAP
jgi:hypothetical protein